MTAAAEWYFKLFIPGDNLSDPKFAGAHFTGDDESALARSLVREAIQNSLDAKRPDATIVTVRLMLRRGPTAVLPGASHRFTGGIWPHLKASSSGLSNPPSRDETVPCLIVEDFGTHGLRGDPEHWQPTGVEKNGYFLFFRALGRSGKSNEDRGRWGVGKFVFPMCSRAHTIWGYTVPSTTNRALLMGRTVLDTHDVEGESFHPDGHWGIKRDPNSNFVSPVTDPGLQQKFRQTFGLKRTTEPGLSVVIPWVLPDVSEANLVLAAVTEYFLPIFKRQLRVIVADGESETVIDEQSIAGLTTLVSKPLSRARLELARRVTTSDALAFRWPLAFSYDDTEWSRDDVPADLLSEMREALEAEIAISVELSLTVRRKDTGAVDTGTLFVHLQRAEGLGSARPLIVREGISVSGDKTKSIVDHVAILTADDGPVATLIGDAETPAHEALRPNFIKEKYTYHQKVISFIREAPWALLRIIRETDQSDDPLLLAAYFPLQSGDGRKGPRVDPRKRGGNPPVVPSIPRSPRRFRIARVEGGFKVMSNPEHAIRPAEVRVLAAYDVRRGDPFKRYRRFDFDLAAEPIAIELSGCELIAARGNELTVSIVEDAFSIEVTGFDAHRDLIVRALPSGGVE